MKPSPTPRIKRNYRRKNHRDWLSRNFLLRWVQSFQDCDTMKVWSRSNRPPESSEDDLKISIYSTIHPRTSLWIAKTSVGLPKKLHLMNSPKKILPVSVQSSHFRRAYKTCLLSPHWVCYMVHKKLNWIHTFTIVLFFPTNVYFLWMEKSTNKAKVFGGL